MQIIFQISFTHHFWISQPFNDFCMMTYIVKKNILTIAVYMHTDCDLQDIFVGTINNFKFIINIYSYRGEQ